MRKLKQSTSVVVSFGPAQDKTDGVTLETGLVSALDHASTGIKLSKNGGALTVRSATVTASTYDSYGNYLVTLSATDTNTTGHLLAQYTDPATNLAIWAEFEVVPAVVYDAQYDPFFARSARGIITYGTAQSATGTTLVMASAESNADDVMVGATLMAYGTTQGYWQSRTITDMVNSTDTLTVDTWTVTPSGTIYYMVLAGAPASSTVLPSVNATQLAGQTITAAAGVTFPSSVASPTNITAGTITTVTNLTNAPTSGDLTTTMKASVNAEVVDVLRTDTVTELTAPPAANAALSAKINWLFMKARNVITQTATTQLVKADDGTTTVGTATVSDDGTTATRGEFS